MIRLTDSLDILAGGLVAYVLLFLITTHSGPVNKYLMKLWVALVVFVEVAGCVGVFLWVGIHPITIGAMAFLGVMGLLIGRVGWERLKDEGCPGLIMVWEKLYADEKKMFAFWVKIAILMAVSLRFATRFI